MGCDVWWKEGSTVTKENSQQELQRSITTQPLHHSLVGGMKPSWKRLFVYRVLQFGLHNKIRSAAFDVTDSHIPTHPTSALCPARSLV